MIRIITLSITLLFLVSCSNETDVTTETQEIEEIVEPIEEPTPDPNQPGEYQEFYPSGALKIEGKNNSKGHRNGLWISYYENGIKWSESYYVDGIKNGHSLTFFPNGGIRYVGEYKNDIKIGLWKFYDEAGEIVNEEEFE